MYTQTVHFSVKQEVPDSTPASLRSHIFEFLFRTRERQQRRIRQQKLDIILVVLRCHGIRTGRVYFSNKIEGFRFLASGAEIDAVAQELYELSVIAEVIIEPVPYIEGGGYRVAYL